jgi:hypothetical protein
VLSSTSCVIAIGITFLVVAVLVIVTLVIVSGGHLYIILSLNDVTKSRDVTGCPIFSRPVRY